MEDDYRRSRREAAVAGLIWFLAALWTVGVSYWLGYNRPALSVGGVPEWVVWGIFAPWIVFFLIHAWYSLIYVREPKAPPPTNPEQRGE